MKMNNEMIKNKLLNLYDTDIDFTVIMTGKKSKTVNGFYKPLSHEIFLHNENFINDNQLMYTAIHEYAHHIVTSNKEKKGIKPGNNEKSHTPEFWSIMDSLLETAVTKGIYVRKHSEKLSELIQNAEQIDHEIASLKIKLGKIMEEIKKQADDEGERFEDIVSHELKIKTATVKKCLQVRNLEENSYGQDEIDIIAKTAGKKQEIKKAVNEAIEKGTSIEAMENIIKKHDCSINPKEKLIKEKKRIEKTIQLLNQRLETVCEQLAVI